MQTEMTAGPELDRLVAENVMGWKKAFDDGWNTPTEGWVGFVGARFSTDISAAWKVVDACMKRGIRIDILACVDGYDVRNIATPIGCYCSDASQVPAAICITALRAVEGKSK